MDFIRGQNTLYFSWDFDFKIRYPAGPVKLPGLSRNRPLVPSPGSWRVSKMGVVDCVIWCTKQVAKFVATLHTIATHSVVYSREMAAASLRFPSACEENLDKVLNDHYIYTKTVSSVFALNSPFHGQLCIFALQWNLTCTWGRGSPKLPPIYVGLHFNADEKNLTMKKATEL